MKVEIVEFKTGEVVKTIDCEGRSLREVNKVDDGVNINLNHKEYFTRIVGIEHEKN